MADRADSRGLDAGMVAAARSRDALGGRRSSALRAKRVLDLVAACLLLVALSPVMLVIGVAVRLDSRGAALFRQERVGHLGRKFVMYKFRTMRNGCRHDLHREYVRKLILESDEDHRGKNGFNKLEDDSRVTRVGRVLRRTSLDELPQLFNVLKGEMSLVGPRPALAYETELYQTRYLRRLEAVPGMTGLWQVSGRTKTTFEEMMELDLSYIDRWSLGLDLRILARTVPVVIGMRGAW